MHRVYAVTLESLAPTTSFKTFSDVINVIVQNAVVIGSVITFFLLVLGGFGYIMGAGSSDTKKLESGKKTITGAVVGLIIILTAVWIVQLLETLTGIKLLGGS